MRQHSRARVRRRSAAGRYVALLPLAAVAVAAYVARNHHPEPSAASGGQSAHASAPAESGPELAAFSVEDYVPGETGEQLAG